MGEREGGREGKREREKERGHGRNRGIGTSESGNLIHFLEGLNISLINFHLLQRQKIDIIS